MIIGAENKTRNPIAAQNTNVVFVLFLISPQIGRRLHVMNRVAAKIEATFRGSINLKRITTAGIVNRKYNKYTR